VLWRVLFVFFPSAKSARRPRPPAAGTQPA
jgi:hypothetical protein